MNREIFKLKESILGIGNSKIAFLPLFCGPEMFPLTSAIGIYGCHFRKIGKVKIA